MTRHTNWLSSSIPSTVSSIKWRNLKSVKAERGTWWRCVDNKECNRYSSKVPGNRQALVQSARRDKWIGVEEKRKEGGEYLREGRPWRNIWFSLDEREGATVCDKVDGFRREQGDVREADTIHNRFGEPITRSNDWLLLLLSPLH